MTHKQPQEEVAVVPSQKNLVVVELYTKSDNHFLLKCFIKCGVATIIIFCVINIMRLLLFLIKFPNKIVFVVLFLLLFMLHLQSHFPKRKSIRIHGIYTLKHIYIP